MCYHFQHGFVAITELGMDMEILWRKALYVGVGFDLTKSKGKRWAFIPGISLVIGSAFLASICIIIPFTYSRNGTLA